MLKSEIREEIITRLKTGVSLYKVILFGSFAWGNPVKDSDIDLVVVTDDDFMPTNYKENMENYLRVSSLLRDMRKEIPMDLIVHTKAMHKAFIQSGSMFSREVMTQGQVLYEKDI
jgi:predicted nucleotidyltransferase